MSEHISRIIGKIQFTDRQWCRKACETLSQMMKDDLTSNGVFLLTIFDFLELVLAHGSELVLLLCKMAKQHQTNDLLLEKVYGLLLLVLSNSDGLLFFSILILSLSLSLSLSLYLSLSFLFPPACFCFPFLFF
jgi:hypothetical protein